MIDNFMTLKYLKNTTLYDAVIIGGGFYGSNIAIYLAKERGFHKILLIEKESSLLTRASFNNQARVHNGYHYPRSFTTAYRSRINLPKFVRDWPSAVIQDFTKIYAIPRSNSKVSSKQFERFCKEIGASLTLAHDDLRRLFEPRLIENVYLVQEYAFNAAKLAKWAEEELLSAGVEILLSTTVTEISKGYEDSIDVTLKSIDDSRSMVSCNYIFNCTYSGLNQFKGDFLGTQTGLKHEIAEMALMQLPPELDSLGITVMDGPFFSLMPFPAQKLHTLSHVRYTPHLDWIDELGVDPYKILNYYDKTTRVDRMIRDVKRYLPAIQNAKYVESLFEVKTILEKNESDDGRPILFEKHSELLGCYSVLGGKIDNIYEVFEKMDSEKFIKIPNQR